MIGIIGNGMVGSRIAKCFKVAGIDIRIYDIKEEKREHELADLLEADAIFICVPTPTIKHQNITNVIDALNSISNYKGSVIIKSTVLPGTTRKLSEIYDFTLLHSAEFLNAHGSLCDITKAPQLVVGCERPISPHLHDVFVKLNQNVVYCSYEDSEVIKYCCNVFYAIKNSFFNLMRLCCENVEADYEFVRTASINNGWIHPMHTYTPGRDGKRGYGGDCLPKDMAAFIKWCEDNNVESGMLLEAHKLNNKLREMQIESPKIDWEDYFHRA